MDVLYPSLNTISSHFKEMDTARDNSKQHQLVTAASDNILWQFVTASVNVHWQKRLISQDFLQVAVNADIFCNCYKIVA